MGRLEDLADRCDIEALRGEFADAGMMRDFPRLVSLFTEDAVWRIPGHIEFLSRCDIRSGTERAAEIWEFVVQTVHQGTIRLDGDTATGRTYISELGKFRNGTSLFNYGLWHDRYRRTPNGWKFSERVYEWLYVDTTPLAGSPPGPGKVV